jgi:hypothetical protein
MASKITSGTLPANHRMFTGEWSISTFRRPVKKDTTPKKNKKVVKDNKEG